MASATVLLVVDPEAGTSVERPLTIADTVTHIVFGDATTGTTAENPLLIPDIR